MSIRQLIYQEFKYLSDDNPPFTPLQSVTRNDLYKLMGVAKFKVGAEIGVWNGINAREIFSVIPNLHLYCIDAWTEYNQERLFTDKEMHQVHMEAISNLRGLNVEMMKTKSMLAAPQFSDGELDFVYIDACHYFNEFMLDLILWAPKVKPGGIVAGHDFRDLYKCGVVDAVKAYTRANKIDEWFITYEEFPSWFWVVK